MDGKFYFITWLVTVTVAFLAWFFLPTVGFGRYLNQTVRIRPIQINVVAFWVILGIGTIISLVRLLLTRSHSPRS